MSASLRARPIAAVPAPSPAAPEAAPAAPADAHLWLLGLGVWTALTLLSITQTAASLAFEGETVHWGRLVAWRALDWYSCALFIPGFYWLVRRAPLERRAWRSGVARYGAATIAATLAKYALLVPLQARLFGATDSLGAVLAGSAIGELMIFWAVVGVLHAVEFHRRYREREATALALRAALGESQLQALRAQLHPHFLFNTLNAATTLLHRDADAADAMLTRLAELLRLTLRTDPAHETTLREEAQVVGRYVDIMRVRFADSLTVALRIPDDLGDARVPAFILQPLVENALEHGVAAAGGHGCVEVSARRDGDRLVLQVRDDGGADDRADARDADDSAGIGLANTRARLAALHGDDASLTLERLPDGGTAATLRLPYREHAARR